MRHCCSRRSAVAAGFAAEGGAGLGGRSTASSGVLIQAAKLSSRTGPPQQSVSAYFCLTQQSVDVSLTRHHEVSGGEYLRIVGANELQADEHVLLADTISASEDDRIQRMRIR